MIENIKLAITSLGMYNITWIIYGSCVLIIRFILWLLRVEDREDIGSGKGNKIEREIAIMLVCFFWPLIPLLARLNGSTKEDSDE